MNNTIQQALVTILNNASFGYPVAWPSVNFTPPATGVWLETAFSPSADLDEGLSYSDDTIPRGFFQVTVYDRPNRGVFVSVGVAESVQSLFAKGTVISGNIRVVRKPDIMSMIEVDDRIGIPVSVEYSG